MAYGAEKALNDLGDKVPAGDRAQIESKITALREALKGEDTNRIRELTEEVQQASYALSQQMYAGQQSGHSGGASGPEHGPDGRDEGEVVEGEFREV